MICLRCGYCCVHLDVAILNPKSIKPDGSIDPECPDPIIFKPAGLKCPHLRYEGEMAVCTIHELDCYRQTPCYQFEQFGREDDVCVLGSYFKAEGCNK